MKRLYNMVMAVSVDEAGNVLNARILNPSFLHSGVVGMTAIKTREEGVFMLKTVSYGNLPLFEFDVFKKKLEHEIAMAENSIAVLNSVFEPAVSELQHEIGELQRRLNNLVE